MNMPCKLYIRRKLDNCSIRLKYIIKASFSLRKCQEPVRHETTDGSSVEFIGQHEQNGIFELIKVRKQLAPRQEIISPPENANQWDNGTF